MSSTTTEETIDVRRETIGSLAGAGDIRSCISQRFRYRSVSF
jgi:hypothetical protein